MNRLQYEADILNTSTGEIRRTAMWAAWSDRPEGSRKMYREKMCDCNLHGYYARGQIDLESGTWKFDLSNSASNSHTVIATSLNPPCDHSMPPTRYKALRAHLPGGEVVELP